MCDLFFFAQMTKDARDSFSSFDCLWPGRESSCSGHGLEDVIKYLVLDRKTATDESHTSLTLSGADS